jgi:hypothetical protein
MHDPELRPGGSRLRWRVVLRRSASVLGVAASAVALHAAPAAATDSYPCGKQVQVPWSIEPVQPCPLTSPLVPNNWVPVYRVPVSNPQGHAPPAPQGWLKTMTGRYFQCDRLFTGAMYYHPSGWRNNWWATTRDDAGHWGWVPEAFFKGGDDDEPDYGLRTCTPPPAPPAPPAPTPTPTPGACDPTPGASGLHLTARIVREGRVATAHYGRSLKVRGSLRRSDGTPYANAPLCVASRDAVPGASRVAADLLVTDAQGRFTYRLAPGPSRRVWLIHRSGAGVATASVVVRVRARARLRALPRRLRNGQTMLLRGQVRGRPLRQRLLVEVQAHKPTGWQTFGTVRAQRGGRFRFGYVFTNSTGVNRYTFRARIPSQPGYPYVTGGSNLVHVRVTG